MMSWLVCLVGLDLQLRVSGCPLWGFLEEGRMVAMQRCCVVLIQRCPPGGRLRWLNAPVCCLFPSPPPALGLGMQRIEGGEGPLSMHVGHRHLMKSPRSRNSCLLCRMAW